MSMWRIDRARQQRLALARIYRRERKNWYPFATPAQRSKWAKPPWLRIRDKGQEWLKRLKVMGARKMKLRKVVARRRRRWG